VATHELIKGADALDDADGLVAFLAEALDGQQLSEAGLTWLLFSRCSPSEGSPADHKERRRAPLNKSLRLIKNN